MRIVAVANQKGGCGKTTTSVNLAACLAHLEKKTLLVDLDPQGHSTCGLGKEAESLRYTLYDLLKLEVEGRPPLEEVLTEVTPGLVLLPSYVILSRVEEEYANLPDWHKPLASILDRSALKKAGFEYVIVDCPPNLGILTYNAFHAADEVIIPIEPSFFSLHGLAKISETLGQVNQKRTRALRTHALMTIFDSRTCFSKEVYDDVKEHFKDRLFKTIIHESVLLKESAAAGQSIVHYAPKSTPCRDYLHLALEYLERVWEMDLPAHELGWQNIVKQRYGPKRVIGGILFQALNPEARTIELAGDFNQWVPRELVRRNDDGLWQIVLPIQEKRTRYKFIVDGEWQMDPYQLFQKKNDFGSFDSYLELEQLA